MNRRTAARLNQPVPGSVFTPAIDAWGATAPGLSGIGALPLPSWAPYGAIAALLGLAVWRKIPWWAGLTGSAAVWWFMLRANNSAVNAQTVTSGIGVVADGSSLQLTTLSPGLLTADASGNASLQVGGLNYPVLSTDSNADGTTTYYLDNPTG